MTGAVFAVQRAQLARRGFRAVPFSYASTRLALDEIAARLASFIDSLHIPRVDLIGHSLGGLVILDMLSQHPEVSIGRAVLMGTPCNGSRTAQQLARTRAGRSLVGQAILQWRPERAQAVMRTFELGMIAGTVPLGLGRLFVRLPPPHDCAVCVEETRLPGLRDHAAMPVSHSGMLLSSRVTRQICHFLENGHFAHA